ncbi:MAG: PDZ domain-containing protein [Calditrichaeota bacterium]|nr:MAG: PDZ domain-containing protein [Calditrichota bacterium]
MVVKRTFAERTGMRRSCAGGCGCLCRSFGVRVPVVSTPLNDPTFEKIKTCGNGQETTVPELCETYLRISKGGVPMKTSFKILVLKLLIFFAAGSVLFAQGKTTNGALTLAKLSAEFETLSEAVSPAVVQILATGYVPSRLSSTVLTKERSAGSGVILDPEGFILTNAHVVDGAKRLQVALANAKTPATRKHSILKPRGRIVGAQLVGLDRETDLAVIKVEESNLPFLELGDSEQVRKGQVVLAFGSPLGLENSVTMGVVSSIARQLRPEDPMIYIQTDAPINPGNSGGPLVDTRGRVIGINTLIFTQSGGSEGIGFAAPSNIARNVYLQIKNTGRVHRGEIGAQVQTITPLLAAGLGLPKVGRVVVSNVEPTGPADKAGLRVGDVILTLDGKSMENGRQFDVNLYSRGSGDFVLLEIRRGTVNKILKVMVRERPDDPERFADLVSPKNNLIPRLGLLGLDLDETIERMLPPLRIKSGVVVANRANLYYEEDELQPGDVIHAINNQTVGTLAELKAAVEKLNVYDPVVLQVERRGKFHFIAFEME